MIAFLSNMFGYLLNFFYNIIGNYGIAIILFSLTIKIVMIPLSFKQQKSQQKSVKLQSELKQIQFKYKNDPEKMNQATMELYKREKMSPFSGCLLAILQMVILFSVFYMVREPLTYMKKMDSELISKYVNTLKEEQLLPNEAYAQIGVIGEANRIKALKEENAELSEKDAKLAEVFGENLEQVCTNMYFLGIDLSKVPTQSLTDFRVYIIPALYVISSFLSMKLTTLTQLKTNKKKEDEVIEIKEEDNEEEKALEKVEPEDPMQQATKSMSMIMPIMAVSISLIAPLGLALYWLTNNILMIAERLILNKVIEVEEEE